MKAFDSIFLITHLFYALPQVQLPVYPRPRTRLLVPDHIGSQAGCVQMLSCSRDVSAVERVDVSRAGVAEASRPLAGRHTGQLVCAVTPVATRH